MIRKNNQITLALALIIMCAGCSNKGLYEVMQGYEKRECLDEREKYHECMAKERKSYEDYKAEREQVLEDKK